MNTIEISFRIKDTECNSKVYGACEVCGRDAAQVFYQVRSLRWLEPRINQFITNDKPGIYGHYACLMEKRTAYTTA